MVAVKEEKLVDGKNFHLLVTPDKLYHCHVKYSCTPCCVLDTVTAPCLSQVAWNCSPCNNHCQGWLKNTLSYFWPGEYKKKKKRSCKNRVANPKFFSYTTVRLLLQELPCQDLVRRKRSHSYMEGDLPEVP